ncbi:hypothetical protein [Bradyrhizobium sp. B120]|uniref:hypothetical protein n=1 Tax=Bradyrhizobium sp. B120 TaxID=3410088 RepID=UPI003B984600
MSIDAIEEGRAAWPDAIRTEFDTNQFNGRVEDAAPVRNRAGFGQERTPATFTAVEFGVGLPMQGIG